MRTITDHIVAGDPAPQLQIVALDSPGHGGACHEYRISATYAKAFGAPLEKLAKVDVNPDGSIVGDLCYIPFQNSPIKEVGVNGVTQEALLAVVIDRLRSFQAGPFACAENALALSHCEQALVLLQIRTRNRLARGVEGTNQE